MNLQVDKEDRWQWHLKTSNAFSVRSAYKVLATRYHSPVMETLKPLWHKDIPLKVVLFGWRLFRDRLPTKDNLIRCGVIAVEERLCVGGCGMLETSSHLLLHCRTFGEVWHFIHNWLGVCSVLPNAPADHFLQFNSIGGNCFKVWMSILHLIWYATIWEIWKEINNMLFNDKECSIPQIMNKIKSLTFYVVEGEVYYSSFQLPCLVALVHLQC